VRVLGRERERQGRGQKEKRNRQDSHFAVNRFPFEATKVTTENAIPGTRYGNRALPAAVAGATVADCPRVKSFSHVARAAKKNARMMRAADAPTDSPRASSPSCPISVSSSATGRRK
jgi:hypothetical protein